MYGFFPWDSLNLALRTDPERTGSVRYCESKLVNDVSILSINVHTSDIVQTMKQYPVAWLEKIYLMGK